jgi:CRISPR-associated protein Csb2
VQKKRVKRKVAKARVRIDMPLTLAQAFPLGRFHATRWNQNPFEDPYGEWPPSPWRLLRALAARWFQYSRETGDANVELRDRLLSTLAREVPSFNLPDGSWRGGPIKQYQPTGVGWSDAQKKNPGYKRPGSTLVQDHYRAIPPDSPILWMWELREGPLDPNALNLLRELLKRMLYFGRAESFCRFALVEGGCPSANCRLSCDAGSGNPVLVPLPNSDLNLDALLASTDGDPVPQEKGYRVRDLLKHRRIPPGTVWYYATIPARKPVRPSPAPRRRHPPDVRVLQFAVGGRVYPPEAHQVKLTERFREEVIRQRCLQVSGGRTTRPGELTSEECNALSLIRGLDAAGNRVDGQKTAFFALIPDGDDLPTRLLCWRVSSFTDDEIDAFLAATERPMAWERGSAEWQVRLVALPFSVPPPADYWSPSQVWQSVTPFVLPAGRQRFRRHGRHRPGETPEVCLRKLLVRFGLPEPSVDGVAGGSRWVTIHETPQERQRRSEERGTRMRPGYRFQITFPTPVPGPICIGHSCHFGLGLFRRGQS